MLLDFNLPLNSHLCDLNHIYEWGVEIRSTVHMMLVHTKLLIHWLDKSIHELMSECRIIF